MTLIPRKLNDRELADAVAASDVIVLPYVRSLNSGAAALAVTFGVPIIAPPEGAFASFIGEGAGVPIEGDTVEDLADAMARFLENPTTYTRAAIAYRDRIDPDAVSRHFAEQLVERIAPRPNGAPPTDRGETS